jgi:hypothetical protein
MQLIPNALAQFIDSSGAPLASGTVGFYFPGTLNPKATFQDMAGTIANPNPVPLNSRGQALIWGSGVYRQIVKDASGVTIWDQITEDPNAGLTGNITDAKFVAGIDFTPGTTTSLTLPAAPGASTNMWTFFDAAYQADDQILSLAGTTLTFVAPIPVGVQEVNIKIGTTVAVGTPGAGSVTDATVAPGANIDSAKLSFLQAGGGAVRRTVQSKLRDVVCVKDFGAKGDGTTDDTAAMTLAHATGRVVYYPAGTYVFSTLTIPQGGIVGESKATSILSSTDATSGDTISLPWASTAFPPSTGYLFRDFQVQAAAGKTGGNLINVNAPSTENNTTLFDSVILQGGPTQLAFTKASYWVVRASQFEGYSVAGIVVDNQDVSDAGDSCISDCLFNTSSTNGIGVVQHASGGLKIVNSKFLGGNYGYFMGWTGTTSSDLLISNCSIENMATAAISLSRTSGAGLFSNIVLTGIQIAICPNGISFSDVAGFINNVVISDIVVSLSPGSGSCIGLNNTSRFRIGPTTLIGNGGSPTGLAFAAGCSNGKFDYPVSAGLSLPVSNSSSSVFRSDGLQQGTQTVVTNAGQGSVFIGTANITFPVPYQQTPVVHCYPNSSAGGAAAGFASGVSTSGFTLNAIGGTNGGSCSMAWDATGNT